MQNIDHNNDYQRQTFGHQHIYETNNTVNIGHDTQYDGEPIRKRPEFFL